MANYSNRLTTLKKRRQDPEILRKAFGADYIRRLDEAYETIRETDSIKYALGAMQPVGKQYTDNTIQEGERVKNQLQKGLDNKYQIEFEYQGSVTNNTHIRAHSDIDLLTIHGAFIMLEPPLQPTTRYGGNPIQELASLRSDCYKLLKTIYYTAEVDNSGAKSISLSGGSLQRKIDVVPSCWLDTVLYRKTGLDYYRGVDVLDLPERKLIKNTPFFHNRLLETKDRQTYGNYKKTVRLLKTLKADAERNINLSSYDIASLLYHMDNKRFWVGDSPLILIKNTFLFLSELYEDDSSRQALKVPDESRLIFQDGGATKGDLLLITVEIADLFKEVIRELEAAGTKLEKKISIA